MWPAMLCALTKSATAASASAVTDRPSRTRFRRARIKCVRLAMLSSRTKPSTVAGVLGSCLVTKVRYLLTRVTVSARSPETSGHCARTAEGRPSISLTVMRGLRGCASDCCPCSIVGHAPWASPATGPPDTGAGSHTEAARSVEEGRRGLGPPVAGVGDCPRGRLAEQAGARSDASWAPAQGAAWLCTSDPLKGRPNWARALLHRGHPHALGPWPPRKTRGQKPARGIEASLSSLPCRTYREGTHGAVQHELVVKHREGQDQRNTERSRLVFGPSPSKRSASRRGSSVSRIFRESARGSSFHGAAWPM